MAETSKPYKMRDHAAMGGFELLKRSNYQIDTDEYAFYVVRTHKGGQINYYYTVPPVKLGPNGGEAKIKLSPGQTVVAYCHSHPKRINDEKFGTDDEKEFGEKIKIFPLMVWYLLTPNKLIRLAESEKEFREGRPIEWLLGITP